MIEKIPTIVRFKLKAGGFVDLPAMRLIRKKDEVKQKMEIVFEMNNGFDCGFEELTGINHPTSKSKEINKGREGNG